MSNLKRQPTPLEDVRQFKRSAPQTTLEIVHNDLDDTTHARLDKVVLEACDDPPESVSLAVLFLIGIVQNSEGKLDQKYEHLTNARELVKEHPELVAKLKEAWNDKSLKQIRNLKDAVIRAWNIEYHGTAYEVLLQAVDEVHVEPSESQYAKIIPVAQSSGTGKSKTIDKIATERILFPICLREDLSEEYFAYPYTDIAVRDHLLDAPSAKQEQECKAYLRSFLCSLFTSARFQAQNLCNQNARVPYTRIAEQFYQFFASTINRDRFYGNVIAAIDPQNNTPDAVLQSFQEFENSLKMYCISWPMNACPIIVSMDEIHVLFKPRIQDTGSVYDLYSRLKSVLSEAVSASFCFIFLSTATSVSKLAPSKEVAPSMRERADERLLPAPVTEFPFDVHLISDPLFPGTVPLASVGSLEFTAKFGRPLFYATYLSRKAQKNVKIVEEMMLTIREKLSGRRWPPTSPAVLDASSMAIMSSRFLLDLSPTASNSRRYEEEQVHSHLRMLYSVHQDRQIMVTGNSSEPLIAEASAQIMNYFIGRKHRKKPYMNIWGLLVKFVDDGLVPQGTIGELIGRVLSILAMDRAIHALTKHHELKYQTPITVAGYYRALLTDEAWESLRQSTPVNGARLSAKSAARTFENAFVSAYFHFSHYGRANDATPMQDVLAWALWLCGIAILCQPNQALTDRAIPIVFTDLGAPSPESVSIVFEQDKAGHNVDLHTIGTQSAESLGVFSQGNKPYIAAVHCYALTSNEGIHVSTASSYDLRHPDQDQEAPRYQIDFQGLAAYREVTTAMKINIRSMIDGSKNSLFKGHPRKYGLPTLQQMLPLHNGGLNATRWIGNFGNEKQRAIGDNESSSLGDAHDARSTSSKQIRPAPKPTAPPQSGTSRKRGENNSNSIIALIVSSNSIVI